MSMIDLDEICSIDLPPVNVWLTEQERSLWMMIAKFISAQGEDPTRKLMCHELQLTNGELDKLLAQLIRKDYIKREKYVGIVLLKYPEVKS